MIYLSFSIQKDEGEFSWSLLKVLENKEPVVSLAVTEDFIIAGTSQGKINVWSHVSNFFSFFFFF